MTHPTDFRALVADDGYASSFQNLGQYRTALLKALSAAPQQPSDEDQPYSDPPHWCKTDESRLAFKAGMDAAWSVAIARYGGQAAPVPVAERLLGAVAAELAAARAKFPQWPTDPVHAAAVIAEELGELQQAIIQVIYEPGKASPQDVEKEAIQVAAMALRFLASLGRYVYPDGLDLHDQSEELPLPEAQP